MAVKRQIPLPTLSGVAAGFTATADIPIGPRYHQIWLRIADGARHAFDSIVGEIRIKVNGKTQRVHTAAELNALNKLMGPQYSETHVAGTPDGVAYTLLPIFFGEPWRKRIEVGAGLAWATGAWSTFQLELDILAGASSPSVSGWAEVDSSVVTGAGNTAQGTPSDRELVKVFKTNLAVNGTSQDVVTLPRRDRYTQISLIDPNISGVRVQVEGITVRELSKEQIDAMLIARDMVPVAGRTDLVFDDDDSLDSSLPMVIGNSVVNDFQLRLLLSSGTARNIGCIYQLLGRPE